MIGEHVEALLEVRASFRRLALARSPVYHQLVWSPEPKTGPDTSTWGAFIRANKAKASGFSWEEWRILPDGSRCSRFTGRDSPADLDEVLRLAAVGGGILNEMRRQTVFDGFKLPVLEPPVPLAGWDVPSTHLDWLLALHDTATASPGVHLRVCLGHWRWEATGADYDPDEVAGRMFMPSRGDPYPASPFVEALLGGVAAASAEAVGRWLEAAVVGDPTGSVGYGKQLYPSEGQPAEPHLGVGAATPLTPRWVRERGRRLLVGDRLIKQYRQRAENQVEVLQAFHDRGWPPEIADILPPNANGAEMRQLSETVRALNANHHTPGVLRFYMNGTGTGVFWEITI